MRMFCLKPMLHLEPDLFGKDAVGEGAEGQVACWCLRGSGGLNIGTIRGIRGDIIGTVMRIHSPTPSAAPVWCAQVITLKRTSGICATNFSDDMMRMLLLLMMMMMTTMQLYCDESS